MLVLLNQDWPWLVIGVLCVSWGVFSLQLNLSQWVKIGINLFFNNFSDQTQKEKKELAAAPPLDEVMASNVGCTLILIGLISFGFGIIRWVS